MIVDCVIPSLVTDAENNFLISVPFIIDILNAVSFMDVAYAPDPDGFSSRFYQRCWDMVVGDVVHVVRDFFLTKSSFFVLLLKLRNSISIDQFRPIMLSNFLFKISSKILADQLARTVVRVLSPQQFDFIRDHHIEDYITLPSDCVNVLHKKCYGEIWQ
ncbi:hypothetical protein Ddye_012862 [Dipteronia dyeriana]|uniref:Reverse transcriptase domain-containing protein n=1 Tax=Dipteronia dyeriana TaxID=168575 RepID=A0AAE0CJ28_9ROSI|nr:hypothetical protein Ddye_012862 [Dipteronia dyeriana]